jgi:superfamily I DNA/RNA helicase
MALPLPIGRQREVLYLPATGHTAVLGTAGSGKTTLAILRSAYLADEGTSNSGPTLLLTFNKTLISYLRHLAGKELKNVRVENYHFFARGYLDYRGLMKYDAICTPETRASLIADAVAVVCGTRDSTANAAFSDALKWMYQLGHSEKPDAISGMTNVLGLDEETAITAWEVRLEYERARSALGKSYDWDDIALTVNSELRADSSPRMYRHIVIDEGQDFSPVMIRSLARAIDPKGSLTFFGDVAQQIYGRLFSWREAGLKIDEPWIFQENYRNSGEIAKLALAITKHGAYRGIVDMVAPRITRAEGPKPVLVQCGTPKSEVEFIVKNARSAAQAGTAAILVQTREDEQIFAQKLKSQEFTRLHRDLGTWNVDAGLYVGTFHAAKGLEFDSVFLPHLSINQMPSAIEVNQKGSDEADAHAARLIYVGVTRARDTLVLSFCGAKTHLLPTDPSLYQQSSI